MTCYSSLRLVQCIQKGGDSMPRGKLPEEEKYLRVSISFNPEQHAQLLRYCQKNERSMSCVIRKALAEWFEKHDTPEE